VIQPRLRAALVIGSIVVASGIAGAAIDRALIARGRGRAPVATGGGGGGGGGQRGGGGPGRSWPEQEARRRNDMLEHMTKDLSLSAAQRAGFDSIMQRTDSSLRTVRREMQPKIQQVFEAGRAEMAAQLDTSQRVKFNAMRKGPPREYRGGDGRGGNRGGQPGRQ
jgi:hypothetical protein